MSIVIKKIRPFYKSHIAKIFANKRIEFFDKLSNYRILSKYTQKIKILEIGCNIGEDFITHLKDRNDLELFGIDLQDYGLRKKTLL